ncbi:hypothetical protein [Dyadobacter sandarakinus]|uniref:Uncharacterized protein n=1 Tax=Dyadobacter sandarakinus TaxID=2747268 RepID=A0ABX7I312_9BACT|nr:hypothetical protein [Dyadobacter sandarakinus]QRR00118.1 hypothetical protein HWI92_03935 [Dyadobacter sandarakinus]
MENKLPHLPVKDTYSTDEIKTRLVAEYKAWRNQVASTLEPVIYPNHAWVVYSGCQTQVLQAAFSNREYAQILGSYILDALEPVLVERSELEEIGVDIDRYKDPVSFGKLPFEIILRPDGEVFECWGPQDGIPLIQKPTVLPGKQSCITGTFWGWTQQEAISAAQTYYKAHQRV